jgi:hypothetical protein
MATIGKLAVQITADTAGLSSGLANAGRQTDNFESKLSGLTSKLKILGPAAVAAGGAFAIGMVKSVANTADELAKLSSRTGVAVEDLSRLQYAAGLSGVSNQTLTASIERLSRGMADAANGTGEAAKAFEAMGISVKNQDGTLRSQREVLEEVAERFSGYADGAEKSALAQQIFGRSGAQLIPLLNSGAKGLKDMADESDRLGNTISTRTAKSAEEFNDNLTRMTTAMGGLARTIAGPVIEGLAKFTTAMFDAWKQGDSLIGMLERGFKRLGQAQDLEMARARVQQYEYQYNKLMDSMSHLEEWERNTAGAMRLAGKLDEARKRLAELTEEQEKAATAPVIGGAAPVTGAGGVTTAAGAALLAEDDKVQEELRKRMEQREERYIEDLERRLEFLRQSMLSEEELAQEKHAKEMETLVEALEARALTEQEYMLMTQDLEMKHMDEMANIRERGMKRINDITSQSWSEQMKNAANFIKGMTANAANGSRTLFNINKAASIANALLSARESITNAYAFGSKIGGPKLGAAFAATAAAATASQIAALKSTSFSAGAGAAGSVAAGGSIAPSELPAATLPNTQTASGASRGQQVTIQLQGETFGREAVRNLISEINEAISDGAVLRLA